MTRLRSVFVRGVVSYNDSILSHELQSLNKVRQEPRGLQRDTHALEGEQSGMMPCCKKTMAAGLPMSINPQIIRVRMKLAMRSEMTKGPVVNTSGFTVTFLSSTG